MDFLSLDILYCRVFFITMELVWKVVRMKQCDVMNLLDLTSSAQ